jgi:hypothetical protein
VPAALYIDIVQKFEVDDVIVNVAVGKFQPAIFVIVQSVFHQAQFELAGPLFNDNVVVTIGTGQ